MDQERIQDLATTQATTGLSGADLYEFETWWPTASDEDKALFNETIDLISMVSLNEIPSVAPPPSLKSQIMASITPKTETTNDVPGYHFILEGEGDWRQLPNKGARIKELSCSRESGTAVFILEMDPGAKILSHDHRGAEEAYVLYGDLHMRGKALKAGDYMRAEPGTKHQDLHSVQGCRALLITSLENYPRQSIRAFDGLHRAWTKCKSLLVSTDRAGR